jgi:pimeloyl-ACP methyl ester carboxylesterase
MIPVNMLFLHKDRTKKRFPVLNLKTHRMKRLAAWLLHLFPFRTLNLIVLRDRQMRKNVQKHGIESNVLHTEQDKLLYWEGGAGKELLFLHGFGGNALLTWEKEGLHFKKHHRFIAPDLLWFGESTSKREPNLLSQCEVIVALLDHLQIEKVTIVGQSYGGFVALGLANYFPERVSQIILANCPGTTFNREKLDEVCKTYHVQTIEELFICKTPEALRRLFDLVTESRPNFPRFIWQQMYDSYFSKNHQEQWHLMRSLAAEQGHFESLAFLDEIPITMLWSENDRLFPFEEGKYFSKCTNAPFYVIPKVGHAPQFDNRKAFTNALKRILE